MNLVIDGLQYVLIYIPLILGSYLSIGLMHVADLSLETAYVSGALCTSYLISLLPSSLPLATTLFILCGTSMIAGMSVGFITSTIVLYMRTSHLVSAIITMGIFYGFHRLAVGIYFSISGYPNALAILQSIPHYPEFSALLCIGLICVIAYCFLLRTELGYAWATYGNNQFFFEHYGISKEYVYLTGVLCANAFAGLSGYLFAQTTGFAEINMGVGRILLCITALVLGQLLRNIRTFSVTIPLIGLFCYIAIQQGLLWIGFDLVYFTMAQSSIILCVLAYTRIHRSTIASDILGI
jgi:putative ABC transport system permease protein